MRASPSWRSPTILGDRDRAFHWLELAIEQNDWKVRVWPIDPAFDPLRADRRFSRLVERVQRREIQASR